MPPKREGRPQVSTQEPAHSKITAASEINTIVLDPETAARYCAGAFCVVVETPAGNMRRRVFMTLKAAEHAVDLATQRGQQAVIVLAELKPLYAVEAGSLQPILVGVAS